MKNILLFGANSFIAKAFLQEYGKRYTIHPVYRRPEGKASLLDFSDTKAVAPFAQSIDYTIDGIVFLQGINPSMGVKDITDEHFTNMLRVNLSAPVLLLQQLAPKLAANCSVVFFSSVAKRKGSYDPSYAAAKSGLTGLIHSLANGYPAQRFNMISLGLVEGSPVYNQMTEDFREKHASRMQNNTLIKAANVITVIDMLLTNDNINRADIAIDGGYV